MNVSNRSVARRKLMPMEYSVGAFLMLMGGMGISLQADVVVEIAAGGHARESCPVTFDIPSALKDVRHFTLVREDGGQEIPVQRFGDKQRPQVMWMIHDRLAAGAKRRYRLRETEDRGQLPSLVKVEDDGAKLTITVDKSPVLKFNHQPVDAPDGIDTVYRRSGYIHPLFTPNGNVVTGDFEKDHPHQHGLFFAWVNATFRGQPADFWNQAKGHGDVEFGSFVQRPISGPVFGQFKTALNHVVVSDGKRIPAITETWVVRVFHSQKPFLFELISRQTPATEDAVQVNEYHYGGLAVRGPSAWLRPSTSDANAHEDPSATADFATSSGRTRADGNETRARWVEMHGPIGSQHGGVIVLGAPSNFRSPQTVRLHPSKPYFCFAPMQLGAFKIESGETYTSRFRFVVHDGPADADLAERMWQDLAHPPQVKVVGL